MKKRLYKVFSLLMALMLLAGCGDTKSAENSETADPETSGSESDSSENAEEASNLNLEGYPIVNESITLKISGKMNESATTWDGIPQLEYLTELTGIEFDAEGISSESWEQQRSLILASDDMPDLLLSTDYTKAECEEYGKEGIFLPLNDLIENYMPNLKATLEEFPEAKAMITSSDGNIYCLPRIAPVVRDMHSRHWLNEKWVANVGLEMPETLEDYYEILKAFKEQDANGNGDPNDEIPLTGSDGNQASEGLVLNALGVNADDDSYAYTADADGNVYCVNTSDGYKEYLKFMNRLYEEELLDQEYFTQNVDQYKAKAQQGIVGATETGAMYLDANTEIGYDYVQIDGLTSDMNDTPMVTSWTTMSIVGAITTANQYPEATARLLDYFYSEEGGILAYVGVENDSWAWIDKEAGTWDKIAPEGYESAEAYRAVATIVNGWPSYERMEFNLGQGSENALWLNGMSSESEPFFVSEFPEDYMSFAAEDQEVINSYKADLETYVAQMTADFIIGTRDIDAEWDAYVKQMDDMGVSEILPIYQAAYDAYLELTE